MFRHVARSHKPVSAYDLIESLAKDGKRLSPVSVYRILEVLKARALSIGSKAETLLRLHDRASDRTANHHACCEGYERVSETNAPDACTLSEHPPGQRFWNARMRDRGQRYLRRCHQAARRRLMLMQVPADVVEEAQARTAGESCLWRLRGLARPFEASPRLRTSASPSILRKS